MERDYHVHFRYRAETRDGYERWHYETLRKSEVEDAINSLSKKGCDKFAFRRLYSLDPWRAWFSSDFDLTVTEGR